MKIEGKGNQEWRWRRPHQRCIVTRHSNRSTYTCVCVCHGFHARIHSGVCHGLDFESFNSQRNDGLLLASCKEFWVTHRRITFMILERGKHKRTRRKNQQMCFRRGEGSKETDEKFHFWSLYFDGWVSIVSVYWLYWYSLNGRRSGGIDWAKKFICGPSLTFVMFTFLRGWNRLTITSLTSTGERKERIELVD